jgi:hypothetical protein
MNAADSASILSSSASFPAVYQNRAPPSALSQRPRLHAGQLKDAVNSSMNWESDASPTCIHYPQQEQLPSVPSPSSVALGGGHRPPTAIVSFWPLASRCAETKATWSSVVSENRAARVGRPRALVVGVTAVHVASVGVAGAPLRSRLEMVLRRLLDSTASQHCRCASFPPLRRFRDEVCNAPYASPCPRPVFCSLSSRGFGGGSG